MTLLEAGFTLGVGAMVLSLLRGTVQKLLASLWGYLADRFTLTVAFSRADPGFDMVRDWLVAHPVAGKAHRVKLVWDPEQNKFVFVPGPGTHYTWFKGRPLVIVYGKKDPNNSWDSAIESYQISVLGRDRSRLEAFVEEMSCFRRADDDRMLVYTMSQGQWTWTRKRKRPLETVYMPDALKQDVFDHVKKFIANETWYQVRGIPWRLGLAFEGPPGTGKTTLAAALAAHLDRPLYSLNLSTVSSDDSLMKAFLSADREGIILIEDIDAYGVTQKRDSGDQPEESPTAVTAETAPMTMTHDEAIKAAAAKKEPRNGVTLSGLLNAIDGVAATEGRILIMTTNYPEKLDPALVRAGRVDRRFFIGPLGPTEVEAMFRCFYPDQHRLLPELARYAEKKVMTAANWQSLFIRFHDSAERLMADVVRPALARRDSL